MNSSYVAMLDEYLLVDVALINYLVFEWIQLCIELYRCGRNAFVYVTEVNANFSVGVQQQY